MDAVVGQGKHIYRVDENWSKMPISIEMNDRVFRFDLSGEQPIVTIAGNGAFLCSWGVELFRLPHAISTKEPVAIAQGATSTLFARGSSSGAVCGSTCTGYSSTSPRRTRSRTTSSPSRSPPRLSGNALEAEGGVEMLEERPPLELIEKV
jgi:hypothetical protein